MSHKIIIFLNFIKASEMNPHSAAHALKIFNFAVLMMVAKIVLKILSAWTLCMKKLYLELQLKM